MDRELKYISFSNLRQSYKTVKDFLETESGDEVKSLDTKIADDLGLWGDDNWDLLTKFVTTFKLGTRDFEYDKHFESEGELFQSGALILTVLSIVFLAPLKLIELISFNKINFGLKVFKPGREKRPLDLSFRDMLTWYIEGQYKLGTQIKYELKK
jgi:hypothetical protein